MWVSKTADRLPIKSWCQDVEAQAMQQAYNLAELPFAIHHVALMPDCHLGYGMPIGGVIALDRAIIPNAVGVDIGCGMIAAKTSLTEIDRDTLIRIVSQIRQEIPVGKNHRSEMVDPLRMPQWNTSSLEWPGLLCKTEWDNARYQLGTLGGGNHFIEIQKGSDSHIWVMLHSGSRNIGYRVAQFHNLRAKELNKRYHVKVPKDLAFLPEDDESGQAYIREMDWCIDFAYANRALMMEIILNIFHRETQSSWSDTVTIAHNFARKEHCFGRDLWVHRKGATPARKGQLGIIPGSQGTNSYIVEGLGNPESFCSCSHGAGRTMSRTGAKCTLDLATEQAKMEGIVHSMNGRSNLDEAPGAYKDIHSVMEQQADLVKPVVELTPLAVVKR